MTNPYKAFVLMPFPEFQSIYDKLIKPALEEAGYEVTRADSLLDQQNIMRDIIYGIAKADLVVADLTSLNANVFYELGLCHGLKIPTVLMAQSMEDVPFDLRPYRIQIYGTRFDQTHKLTNALKDIGTRHRAGDIVVGSPILDFYPSSKEAEDVVPEASTSDLNPISEGSETSDSDEKGILDYSADIERAFDELNEIQR